MKKTTFILIAIFLLLKPYPDLFSQSVEYGKISLASNPKQGSEFKVGERVKLDINVQYSDALRNTDLYVLLLPSYRGQIIINDGKFSMKGLTSNFCGSFKRASSDEDEFNFAKDNYPVSGKIPNVASVFAGLIKKKDISEINLKNEQSVILAFLASFGAGGNGNTIGSVEFTVPRIEEYYDKLIVRPYIFYYKGDRRCANFKSENINELTYNIKSDIPPPPDSETQEKFPPSVGELAIDSYKPTNARLRKGLSCEIKVKVTYKDLEPNSEVYVLLNAVRDDKTIRQDGLTASFPSLSLAIFDKPELEGGYYKISDKNRPAYSELALFGPFEAAYVATVKEGGSGSVEGKIQFTPPPLVQRYTGIRLSPMYFQWRTFRGEYEHLGWLNTKTMKTITIPLEGTY